LVAGSYPAFYLSSFNPVFCIKRVEDKIRRSGNGQERIGGDSVYCFSFVYHKHHNCLYATPACKKQEPGF
jgi:hypothetical protein